MFEAVSVILDGAGFYSGDLDDFKSLLEHLGFKTHPLREVKLDELSRGKVLLICPRYEMRTRDQVSLMLRAIRDGLGALVLLDTESAPHFDFASKFLAEMGIYVSDNIIKEQNDTEHVLLTSINKKHSITSGVNEIIAQHPKALILIDGESDKNRVLVRSSKNHSPPDAIVSCVVHYGNGNVVVFSSCSIANNSLLGKANNAIFLVSSIYWLAGLKLPVDLSDRIARALAVFSIESVL
ncbi:MAG: hypothetical protein NDP13_02140 [Crenarchaeota archaeon]|nr:hypothetical protein [Thermoproteota archaeon]MCR8501475.1 hypothetical protein [Thermoproteota archaeon]